MIRHITASAVILDGDRVLLIYHRKVGGWLYPGGHALPDEDPAETVLREIEEEVGIEAELVGDLPFTHRKVRSVPAPFAILDVAVHDDAIGPHRHIDFVYVAHPLSHDIVVQPDEVTQARWVPLEQVRDLPDLPEELPSLIAAAAHFAAARPSVTASTTGEEG